MKKFLALLLAMIMIMGLVACTPEDEAGGEKVVISMPEVVLNTPERNNAEFYPLDTDTTLRVMFNEDLTKENAATKLWEQVTGIDMDLVYWTHDVMMNSLAAGDIPDCIIFPWDFTKEQVWEFAQGGAFINFLDYLDKMPNLCKQIRENPEILEICAYPDGNMYSLPKVGWSNTSQSNLFYIRTDIMEEMGWEQPPQTTDEFLQFIVEAQQKYGNNPEFIAFVPQNSTYMTWTQRNSIPCTLFPSFGELIEIDLTLDSEGNVVLGAATEQYRYYLEFMNQIWNSGAFATEIYTMDSATGKAIIQNGNCAISVGTSATAAALGGELTIDVMEPLTSKYWNTKQWMKDPYINFKGCVISSKCKDLDAALALVDSFYADETNPLTEDGTIWGYTVAKGVLGKNWTIDYEAGTWTSGTTWDGFSTALYSGNNTLIPTASLTVKGTGTMKSLMPYAVESPKLTERIVLAGDDADEFADRWTDIDKYIGQMHAKFITGEANLETDWDTYLNNLNRMGLETILEIYSKYL